MLNWVECTMCRLRCHSAHEDNPKLEQSVSPSCTHLQLNFQRKNHCQPEGKDTTIISHWQVRWVKIKCEKGTSKTKGHCKVPATAAAVVMTIQSAREKKWLLLQRDALKWSWGRLSFWWRETQMSEKKVLLTVVWIFLPHSFVFFRSFSRTRAKVVNNWEQSTGHQNVCVLEGKNSQSRRRRRQHQQHKKCVR